MKTIVASAIFITLFVCLMGFLIFQESQARQEAQFNATVTAIFATNTAVQNLINATETARAATISPQ